METEWSTRKGLERSQNTRTRLQKESKATKGKDGLDTEEGGKKRKLKFDILPEDWGCEEPGLDSVWGIRPPPTPEGTAPCKSEG